jgi:hypothetical protein
MLMTAKQSKAVVSEYALLLSHCIGKHINIVWPNGHSYIDKLERVEYAPANSIVNTPDKVKDTETGKVSTPHCMRLAYTNSRMIFVLPDIVRISPTVDGAVIEMQTYRVTLSIVSPQCDETADEM